MKKSFLRDIAGIAIIVTAWSLVIFPALEAGLTLAASTTATTSGTTGASAGIQVTARQQVTTEMALTIASTSIILSPAIAGLTGGTGDGSTNVNVVSNNREGFDVTLQASTSPAMKGDNYGGQFNNYTPAAYNTPETWSTTGTLGGEFAYGITNNNTNIAPGFETCTVSNSCFLDASTTAKTIYSTGASTTAAGNSFTLKFRAYVPPNPSPAIVEDWYSATTTITAVMR